MAKSFHLIAVSFREKFSGSDRATVLFKTVGSFYPLDLIYPLGRKLSEFHSEYVWLIA
jgi:hypothetical protein